MLFWTKLEGLASPYRQFIKNKQGTKEYKQTARGLRDKERKEENKGYKGSYYRFWIHKSKVKACLDLVLRDKIPISFSNTILTVEIFGCTPLKMKSFRTVQIAQHIRIDTIKRGIKCCFACI